jgi:uncharacterized protein YbaR (Trm112 family)
MEMPTDSTVSDRTLAILRCPNDGSKLTRANTAQVTELNAAIAAHRLRDRSGKPVERSISGGLVRASGDLLYPIVDGIPVMLYDEAISLEQLNPA